MCFCFSSLGGGGEAGGLFWASRELDSGLVFRAVGFGGSGGSGFRAVMRTEACRSLVVALYFKHTWQEANLKAYRVYGFSDWLSEGP